MYGPSGTSRNRIGVRVLLLAAVWGSVCSCGDGAAPPAPRDSGSGEVSFSFRLSKLAVATMSRAEVVITGPDMAEIRQVLAISGDTVSGTVRGVPAGAGRVFTINGYDAEGDLVYTGSATAEVMAGQQVTVRIALRATGAGGPAKEITVDLPGGASMEFVWIEPGTFVMGAPSAEPGREEDEGPQHEVKISKGFYLGKYEITQGQWAAVIGSAPWSGRGLVQESANNPAACISWDDVQGFIYGLNVTEGDSLYRLPTEAEWEYACRAGTKTPWSFGIAEGRLGDYAWYNANAWDVGERYAHAVGTKQPNPWGLYDMHGNVCEWVQDWYRSYTSSSQTDPTGPTSGGVRAIRGGVFDRDARGTRSALRDNASPEIRDYYLGARLVRTR